MSTPSRWHAVSAMRRVSSGDVAARIVRFVVPVGAVGTQVVGVAGCGVKRTDVGNLDNLLVAVMAVSMRECVAFDAASGFLVMFSTMSQDNPAWQGRLDAAVGSKVPVGAFCG